MFVVVPRDHAYVVERLGKYRHTIPAGLHVLVPLIDRVAFRFSLAPTEQELTDTCISRDNVAVTVSTRHRWRVVNPERAAYATANVADFVRELVRTHQRKSIGARLLDEARETTRELEAEIVRSVAEAAKDAGVEILVVDIFAIGKSR